MHVIPQLRELEHRYSRELVIVGVHSGKFIAERQTENLRQAVLRLGIEHPVVNDWQFRVWRAWGVNAWPTLVLVDPMGRYVNAYPGETTFEAFAPIVQKLVDEHQAKGTMKLDPVPVRPERLGQTLSQLAFPGKVLAAGGQRLFVADTSHNRILVVALQPDGRNARVEAIVGRGSAGLKDGDFESAELNHPQGMALVGDVLYVADTENHAIRGIDLRRRTVTTVAGTGEQAGHRIPDGSGTKTALSSPWDVLAHDGALYIAMAGSHQLWKLDLKSGEIRLHAGSGHEDLGDAPLRSAALAQPSGLATDGRRLFFADSEASAIRSADLAPVGEVRTIVGTGLFDFGDKDGVGDEVRLQHALGVVWHEGLLYVADTYNNRIKVVDPATRRATTLAGTGEAGLADGEQARFDEPGGIGATDGLLYVADTNNHAIRVVDLRTRRVETVGVEGIEE